MKPMSIRDDLNNSPRESFSASEPLSVVGVCLDEETWTVLKTFAESAPLIKLRSHLSEYRTQETDSPTEWLGTPAPEICIVDFDRDRRKGLSREIQALLVARKENTGAARGVIAEGR